MSEPIIDALRMYCEYAAAWEEGELATGSAETWFNDLKPYTQVESRVNTDLGFVDVMDIRVGAVDHGAGNVCLVAYHSSREGLTRLDLWYEDDRPITIFHDGNLQNLPAKEH
jgi:hypothetical protein